MPINHAHICRRVLAPANGCYIVLIHPPNFPFEHAFIVAYMHVRVVITDDSCSVSIERETLILNPFVHVQCDCMHMKWPFLIRALLLGPGPLAFDMHREPAKFEE